MTECGMCNGWITEEMPCPRCRGTMYDKGRAVDFLDEYSPYLDMKYTEMVDGDPDSSITDDCVHVFVCNKCGFQDILAK